MVSLSKLSKVSNRTAALVVFIAWYVSASLTVTILTGQFEASLRASLVILLCVVAFMSAMFVVSRVLKRTDVVDAAWGPAFIIAAVCSFLLNGQALEVGTNVQTLVTGLVIIWALRLSYVMVQRVLGRPEDKRYVALRKKWSGNEVLSTYARVFLVQSLLVAMISSAVTHVNLSLPTHIGVFATIGAAVWLIGFLFESVGDWQLGRHAADPATTGKLLTSGLWKYTRHPNYFGEALMWWGIFIIALQVPYGWLAVVTPVTVTYLLLFVSGVPTTEKSLERKAGWSIYRKRTSQFIPLPPKQG